MLDFCTNPVLLSVVILLILSALRLNVVFSLVIAALCGGLLAGMDGASAMKAFTGGLGNGAQIAFNYAMLGAFSIAISRSGVTELIARELFRRIGGEVTKKKLFIFKYTLLLILTLISISSQNLIPVHIAFIPVLIPPLLPVFEKIRLDRRAVACILTFGLITPYMFLPVGFGKIYLNTILIQRIARGRVACARRDGDSRARDARRASDRGVFLLPPSARLRHGADGRGGGFAGAC